MLPVFESLTSWSEPKGSVMFYQSCSTPSVSSPSFLLPDLLPRLIVIFSIGADTKERALTAHLLLSSSSPFDLGRNNATIMYWANVGENRRERELLLLLNNSRNWSSAMSNRVMRIRDLGRMFC